MATQRTYMFRAAGCFFLFLFAVLGMLIPGSSDPTEPLWKNFDVLLIPPDQPLREIRSVLQGAGEKPLDRNVATVEVEDFLDRALVPVSELYSRFDTDDPRLDPFVRALPELFSGYLNGEPVEIMYVPRTTPNTDARRRELSRLLHDYSYSFARSATESPPLPGTVIPAMTALIVMLVILGFSGHRRLPVSVATVAVIGHSVGAGIPGLVQGVLIALAWARWQDRVVPVEQEWFWYGTPPRMDRAFRRTTVALIGTVIAVTPTILTVPPAARLQAGFQLTLLVGALGFLSLGFSLGRLARMATREHRLFLPRPILERDGGGNRKNSIVVVSVAACVIGVMGLVSWMETRSAIGTPGSESVLPIAVHPGPGEFRVTGDTGIVPVADILENLHAAALEEYPLSTAGYVAHRRYQETMMYGGSYAVPRLDEAVELARFSRDNGRIRDFPETVLVFDEQWVRSQLEPDGGTVYQLFVDEGVPIRITTERIVASGTDSPRNWYGILSVFLGILSVFYGLRLPYRNRIGTVEHPVRSVKKTA